jgi:purine nucleoside permease
VAALGGLRIDARNPRQLASRERYQRDRHVTESIAVPRLSPDYPEVFCNSDDVCLITTGMGHANAAASLSVLVYSGKLDLTESYFLVAGIAGIDPGQRTLGTVAWARYLVDYGIAWEIDAREMPAGLLPSPCFFSVPGPLTERGCVPARFLDSRD